MRALLGMVLSIAVVAGAACEPHEDLARRESARSAPAPYPNVENAAPLHNVAGGPEQARNAIPGDDMHKTVPGALNRAGEAELVPLAAERLHGSAKFEEVGDAVRISLRLEDGTAGPRALKLVNAGCGALAARKAATEAFSSKALGEFEVDEGGEGTLTTNVRGLHLRPDLPGTMLHKALVVTAGGRAKGSDARALACGRVRPD